jgi:DNA-binding response OmpR family regulator
MATILIVDDERLICDLLRAVLGRQGHEVITASNGKEGLELFKQHKPRFTLLDLRMPEMNGIEVLKHIRAIDPKAAVMILTAWGSDALEQQARQLGAMDFLSKGLALDMLVAAMERALPKSAQAPAATPAASPAPAAAALGAPPAEASPSSQAAMDSILVVDDEPPICELMQRFLSLRGYRVRAVHDGPQALAAVEQEVPQLVVLDMNMSGMNGVEVLRKLRAKKYGGGVILLTTGQDDKLLQEALDLGSVDVMGKPVDLERLALAIQVGCILTEQQRGGPGRKK